MTVTIVNTATGVERVVVTDEQGGFRVPALQPGPYTVESSLTGFGSDTQKVVLTVGQVADLQGVAVGRRNSGERARSSAGRPVEIETTKSDLSAVVNQEQLSELPVLNRGFVGLAQLLPGGGPARTGDGRFGISTAFGGTNVRSMYSMQIDGGIMDHPIYGFAIVNVSQDAVQEFRVLRNQFDAEYSRAGTAVVNVVTRSGTNDLQGRVSYFGRDRLAQRQERVRHAPSRRSTRPASACAGGGPLVRNKAFFFGTLEYNRQNSVRIIALPAANPFAGDYNGVYDNGNARQARPGEGRLHGQPAARVHRPLPLRQRRHHRGLRAGREHRPRLHRPLGQLELDARRVDAEQRGRPVSWTRTRSASS